MSGNGALHQRQTDENPYPASVSGSGKHELAAWLAFSGSDPELAEIAKAWEKLDAPVRRRVMELIRGK